MAFTTLVSVEETAAHLPDPQWVICDCRHDLADHSAGYRAYRAVMVREGETVERGKALLVLEAMKMEYTITAPRGGVVARLHCAVGGLVAEGAELIVIDSGEPKPLPEEP